MDEYLLNNMLDETVNLRADVDHMHYVVSTVQDTVAGCVTHADVASMFEDQEARIRDIKQMFTVELARSIVNLVKKYYCFETAPEYDEEFQKELAALYTF